MLSELYFLIWVFNALYMFDKEFNQAVIARIHQQPQLAYVFLAAEAYEVIYYIVTMIGIFKRLGCFGLLGRPHQNPDPDLETGNINALQLVERIRQKFQRLEDLLREEDILLEKQQELLEKLQHRLEEQQVLPRDVQMQPTMMASTHQMGDAC